MLTAIDPNPTFALIKIALSVAVVAISVALWFQLMVRVRSNGGGVLAGIVTAAAIVAVLVSLIPAVMPFEYGLVLLLAALVAIYRPDLLVRYTGGAKVEWRALHEGRELQLLVRERGADAATDPEIHQRIVGLDTLDRPSTHDYIALLRETLLTDPADAAFDDRRAALAAADATLRASLGARPVWERELERRARGEQPAE